MPVTAVVTTHTIATENRWSAEFYDPRYDRPLTKKYAWLPIGMVLDLCQYGLSKAMNDDQQGWPMYRMNEIDGVFLDRPERFVELTPKEYSAYRLQYDDVLFNRTNSFDFVGRTGILKRDVDAVFASYLVRVRPNRSLILPEFLTVYLNTAFGVGQIRRRAMPSINQTNVSAAELKRIPIPLVPRTEQDPIAALVKQASDLGAKAHKQYEDARTALETGLGLSAMPPSRSLTFETDLADTCFSRRFDAQHFRKEFMTLYQVLQAECDTSPLRDLVIFNQRGRQPVYVPEGPVAVVNSQHIGWQHLRSDELEHTSQVVYDEDPRSRLYKDDVIVYATGAYVGRTNVFLEDTPAVASNHVNILRVKPGCDPAYIALLLNSKVGAMQTEKYITGSTQAELYPGNLAKFLIPILDGRRQREIGDKVRESYLALKESRSRIQEAISEVETLVEQST